MQNPHAGERGFEIALEPGLEQVCQDVTEANARRLVACWNACENVDTDLLEDYPLGVISHAIEHGLRQMVEQRNELLDALKELDEKPEHTSSWLRARAAIVKAEGGAS